MTECAVVAAPDGSDRPRPGGRRSGPRHRSCGSSMHRRRTRTRPPGRSPDTLADHGIRLPEVDLHPAHGDDEGMKQPQVTAARIGLYQSISTVASVICPRLTMNHDPAELDELADRVDVRGDPGDHRATAFGVLREHGQIVDVPECGDAQGRETTLGSGGEEAHVDRVCRPRRHDHHRRSDGVAWTRPMSGPPGAVSASSVTLDDHGERRHVLPW